ncbi:hypothetical protein [Agrobacterium tumefaciens]|uniref:hypothetical protein n=1 Tax=Agrobacterium tumefaciens TaxID=358 RepID=UPI0036705C18
MRFVSIKTSVASPSKGLATNPAPAQAEPHHDARDVRLTAMCGRLLLWPHRQHTEATPPVLVLRIHCDGDLRFQPRRITGHHRRRNEDICIASENQIILCRTMVEAGRRDKTFVTYFTDAAEKAEAQILRCYKGEQFPQTLLIIMWHRAI